MVKQHLYVQNCCEDQLLHGKGLNILKMMKYLGNILLVIEVQLVVFSRWVFHFAHLRQLPVLVPYIPTENPTLRDTAYEVCTLLLCPLVS